MRRLKVICYKHLINDVRRMTVVRREYQIWFANTTATQRA